MVNYKLSMSIHNVYSSQSNFKQFTIFLSCHNKKYLGENTIELICGLVWLSLIPADLTLLQFNGMFPKKIVIKKKKEKRHFVTLGSGHVRDEPL